MDFEVLLYLFYFYWGRAFNILFTHHHRRLSKILGCSPLALYIMCQQTQEIRTLSEAHLTTYTVIAIVLLKANVFKSGT